MRQGIYRDMGRSVGIAVLAAASAVTAGRALAADAASVQPSDPKVYRDLTYTQAGGAALRMDLYVPAGAGAAHSMPAVLHLETVRRALDQVDSGLLSHGIAVAIVGYGPDGAEPRAEIAIPSVQAAVAFVRSGAATYGINGNALGIMGKANAATVGALAGLSAAATPDAENARVSAVIMLGGTPNLLTAEANGDESVNEQTGAAYVLFHHNVKERPDKATLWSPSTWVDSNSPAVLSVCGALDHRMPWYGKWIASLRACGVSADQVAVANVYYDLDSPTVADAVSGWCAKALRVPPHDATEAPSVRIERLEDAGLHDAAARLAARSLDAAALAEFNHRHDQQMAAAAQASFAAAIQDHQIDAAEEALWQLRLLDPAAQQRLQPAHDALAQQVDLLLQGASQKRAINQLLNTDAAAAERSMHELQVNGQLAASTSLLGTSMLQDFSTYAQAVRRSTLPPGVHSYPWAQAYGIDLYGYWMDVRIGGQTQRFRYVPPGIFVMGVTAAAPDRLPDEPLARRVRSDRGLWVADTLVTQGMYDAVVGADVDQSYFKGADLPADSVSYAHAENFARGLGIGARLPSEAEFEYACRGPEGSSPAPTGRLSDSAWYWDREMDRGRAGETPVLPELVDQLAIKPTRMTHQVAAKLPNAFGLYDMQGNVWEWCIEIAGTAPHDFHPAHGGAWTSLGETCRPSRRQLFYVEEVPWNVGFRVVVPAE